jgi:hypothetical protein
MSDHLAGIVAAAASAISVAWAFGWVLVLLRRAGGGFSESPSLAMPWLTASVGLAMVAIIELARRMALAPPWTGVVARIGTLLGVCAVIPIVDTAWGRAASLLPLGIAVVGGLAAPLTEQRQGFHGGHTRRRDRDETPPSRTSRALPVTIVRALPPAAGFRQRLERFQTSTEGDRAIGRVIVDVPTGSRTGHAHVGFCPPFVAMPTVEVTSDDDAIEAVVTAAEIVPWGVRVECRLSEAAEEPLAIPVDILARYPG